MTRTRHRSWYCLQNKNMYPLLFTDLPKPQTVMNCINGVVFGENKMFDYKNLNNVNVLQWGGKTSDYKTISR